MEYATEQQHALFHAMWNAHIHVVLSNPKQDFSGEEGKELWEWMIHDGNILHHKLFPNCENMNEFSVDNWKYN